MPRHVGMYRRSELIRLAGIPSEAVLQVAAQRSREAACAAGQHQQETDSDTGDEVCRLCGTVIDDYPDVPPMTTETKHPAPDGPTAFTPGATSEGRP